MSDQIKSQPDATNIPAIQEMLLAALAEELPSGHSDNEAAGDAKDRYRNAVQAEDQRAEQQR